MPLASSGHDENQTQKSEALASFQVDDATLLLIDLDLQLGNLLSQSLFHRLHQPVMSRMGINQDHQIISETRILDEGVLATASALLGSLQHPIYLIEIEVAENG